MLDDAPWTWGSTGGWSNGMPEFFQDMPGGVMDNIYDDLDDSPVSWHITEVLFSVAATIVCDMCSMCWPGQLGYALIQSCVCIC